MAQPEDTKTYIEYDPETQVYCAGCRSVVNKEGRHLCPQSYGAPDQHYRHIVTLRDQFAMAALGEVLHQSKMTDTDLHLAQTAYRLADAMIAARLMK